MSDNNMDRVMSQDTVFSSKDIAACEAQIFSVWQEIHNAQIWSVDYTPGDLPFRALISAAEYGGVVVGEMSGTIKQARRQSRHIAADGRDDYLMLINRGDNALVGEQCGRNYSISKGQAALVSASDVFRMGGANANRWSNIVIPHSVVAAEFPHANDRLAFSIERDNEALRMLDSYCSLLRQGPPLTSEALIAHVGETVIDLIGLATGAKGDRAELAGMRGLRAARLDHIIAEIAAGFTEPDISAREVAKKMGISERYVHDILEQSGTTFSARVTELRLLKAMHMLASPDCRALRIGDIAYAVGFGDISYFNRLFRRRFGISPRGAR